MTSLLDTNVIIRFLTGDKDKKYRNLYSFFESLEKGKKHVVIKHIVLFQTIFVLKSVYQIKKEKIVESLLDLLKYRGIAIKDKKIITRTLEIWRDNNNEIVDCYLVASLENDDQNILYSYDRGFKHFQVNRIEP